METHARHAPLIALGLIALGTLANLIALTRLPPDARIAVHYTADFTPDHVARPGIALLVWLGIEAGLWVVIWVLSSGARHPGRYSLTPRTRAAPDRVWILLTALLIVCQVIGVGRAFGAFGDLHGFHAGLLGVVLLVMGNAPGTLSSNRVIGIRTPWTLRDPDVWDRTHRICGPITILTGLMLILAATGMFGPVGPHVVSMAALLLAACCVLVSWRESRRGTAR